MKPTNLLYSALALALGMAAPSAIAQDQQQSYFGGFSAIFTGGAGQGQGNVGSRIRFLNQPTETNCQHNGNARVANPTDPWGGDYGGTDKYFTLNAGSGTQIIDMEVCLPYFQNPSTYPYFPITAGMSTIQLFIDGEPCPNSNVQIVQPSDVGEQSQAYGTGSGPYAKYLRITYNKANAWHTGGVREFGLRWSYQGGGAHSDLRWKAVMVGASFSELLGYFNAPSLPLYIMRDPPGDASYSEITNSQNTCTGQTVSTNTTQSANTWFKARIGFSGSVGFIVTTPIEIYGEIGVDLTVERSETGEREYQTCVQTDQSFTTTLDGPPEDIFIGSAIRYAYGMAEIVERPSCGTIVRDAHVAMVPVSVNSSYNYTESYIRGTVIPNLTNAITALTPGTEAYDNAVDQLSVWNQTLAMNESIKAAATLDVVRSFNGGGNGQNYSLTTTTEETNTISYSTVLDGGISYEYGVFIGGSGISGGGRLGMRTEYGSSQSQSNASSNTMTYHLEDDDGADDYTVLVKKDKVFGTYVFELDSAASATSCEYEGGYQIDQPELWVGAMDQSSMVLNEVPLSTQAIFPLYVCNNSNVDRTYYLKFQASSNTEGGGLQAFGNTINGNDNGVQLLVPANSCLDVTNLYLTQPNVGVVDFEDIVVYLYALCDENNSPYIRSTVTISAYFGAGNTNAGVYCGPTYTANSTTYGDFIDGVQVASINNMGTGGTTGASYNDYFSQFNTDLSRNGQYLLTVTTGSYAPERVAAWIDYDQDAVFEANEKLGEFNSSSSFQPLNIPFTVPVGALTGPTRMRVRGLDPGNQPGQSVDPCTNYTYGEAEDYKVTINANTPTDCLNAPNGTALPGTACNDGNANTGADTWNANCECLGLVLDCAGTPGGTTVTGSACDDGNANTGGDVYDANCACAGQAIDCEGTAGGAAVPGTACDDADATTGNDVFAANCSCTGQLIDCANTPGGSALPGASCDDGNPFSTEDVWTNECLCAGTLPNDCLGVPGGDAQPGAPCDDGDASTGADVYGTNCICAGQAFDCTGIPGGAVLPGTPCDDGNPESTGDVYTNDCACIGVSPNDCLGVPGGSALPGTACDDGDATTGDDTWNGGCLCIGLVIDCDGVAGGLVLPGNACDDGDAGTGFDAVGTDCICAGQLIDCVGQAGGTVLPGTACDDGNPDSSDDTYNTECLCVGTLTNDCEGNAGGPAQPGTPCDDGIIDTENDTWSANCECAGLLVDCLGVPGGSQLPGVPCDDGDDCTAGDVIQDNCVCTGTGIQLGAISGPDLVFTTLTNSWFVNPVPGATGYNWTLPSGWSSDVTNEFVLTATAGLDVGTVQLCVEGFIGGCVLSTDCFDVNVELYTGMTNVTGSESDLFTVQPNPSSGVFQLIPANDHVAMSITVYDATGRTVKAPFLVAGKRAVSLDLGDAAPGAYYVLATSNGQQRATKLMVKR